MPAPVAQRPSTTLPAWFTRMDSNRDGDVSAREFLGPIAVFKQIDRDGDGLIDANEALKAAE
jgi:Ca2+-binding EF-hand superfamily protein